MSSFIKIYNNNVTPNTKSDKLNGNPLTTRQHKILNVNPITNGLLTG